MAQQIPSVFNVKRQEHVLQDVFTHKKTSCAQWKLYIGELDNLQAESALAEFLEVFRLAITAGPHVLNDLVWDQPCPLAWCKCCDDMDLQLTIEFDTWTSNWDLDVAAVFNRVLYDWDASKESSEFRKLRDVLLCYPQHTHVPPMRLTLGLYRHESSNRNYVENYKSKHVMSVQQLMDRAAISRCNGGYDVKLQWKAYISDCSRSKMNQRNSQQHFSLCTSESTDVQLNDDGRTCPIHELNHRWIALIDGDVSTYIPTGLSTLK